MLLRISTLALYRCVAVCSLACILVAAPAQAAPDPILVKKAKVHVEQARLAYNLGKFDEALRGYEAAYRLVPMPGLLFNLGQCHRHAGNHERAIFFFDGYLREASPEAGQRTLVLDLKKESEAKLAAAQKAAAVVRVAPAPAAPPAPPVAVVPPAAAVPAPPPAAPAVPPQPALLEASAEPTVESSDGIHTKWWFWTLVGVGVAAAGTGTALALSGGSQEDLPSGSLGTVDWR